MPIIDVLPFRACYDCGRNETILAGALRAGRFLRYGCRHGGCGTCRVLLVDGEVEQAGSSFALPRADRADGWILACASAPTGDCVIDVSAGSDGMALTEEEFLAGDAAGTFVTEVAEIRRLTRDVAAAWGHLPGLREAHPVRPGRPGRARGGRHRDRRLGQADRRGPHARRVPGGGAAAVPAPTARGRAAGGRKTASHEHRESRELTVKVIVYADFNCVYCFLASQRADRLTREGIAEIDWRAVEHLPRLPVTGYKPRPGEAQPGGEAGEGDLAEAAQLALPGERLPAGPPSVISNTRAAVSAYAEAIADGIQDRLRLRLFESIWAQGRNMSSAYEVRRVVAALLWPADPIYTHLVSPDLPVRSCTTPTRCGSYAGKAARSRLTEAR